MLANAVNGLYTGSPGTASKVRIQRRRPKFGLHMKNSGSPLAKLLSDDGSAGPRSVRQICMWSPRGAPRGKYVYNKSRNSSATPRRCIPSSLRSRKGCNHLSGKKHTGRSKARTRSSGCHGLAKNTCVIRPLASSGYFWCSAAHRPATPGVNRKTLARGSQLSGTSSIQSNRRQKIGSTEQLVSPRTCVNPQL